MNTFLMVIQVIAIVCTGLAAGVFLGHRAGVSYARHHLNPSGYVHLQQLIHVHFKRMMPVLQIGAVAGSLLWAILLISRQAMAEFWLVVLAFIAMLSIAIMTRAVSIPLNNKLMTWDVHAPPLDLMKLWQPWETVHSIRTVLAMGAFVLQVIALSIA